MTLPALHPTSVATADNLLPYEPLTAPLPYRSEGFAEDLLDEADPAAVTHAPWGRMGTWLSALPMAVTVLSAAASVLV